MKTCVFIHEITLLIMVKMMMKKKKKKKIDHIDKT